ncbi:MAG: hypothetical protein GXO03_00185 [Aquificae bacterium]|nr:hypothetical protein [Aquificota bacterium]
MRSTIFSLLLAFLAFGSEWRFFKEVSFEEIVRELLKYRVVYLGEVHTDEEIHELQLKIIEALYKHDPKLIIAMEGFQQPFQEFLELYLDEEIDEEEMLKGTEYRKRWFPDEKLYAMLWRFAREKGVKVVALNVPTELLREIKKKGLKGVKSVYLPPEPVYPPEEYRKYLLEQMKLHGHKTDEKRFIDVQTAWDNGMAYRLYKLLLLYPEHRIVVIVGKGHLWRGYGIPYVLKKLMPEVKQAILYPCPEERFYLLFSSDFSKECSSASSKSPPN